MTPETAALFAAFCVLGVMFILIGLLVFADDLFQEKPSSSTEMIMPT